VDGSTFKVIESPFKVTEPTFDVDESTFKIIESPFKVAGTTSNVGRATLNDSAPQSRVKPKPRLRGRAGELSGRISSIQMSALLIKRLNLARSLFI